MATEPLSVTLRTLTPIWTGGVDAGKMEQVHETGILGSLRWWYEAIVRGLGGQACDPSQHSCIYDPERPNDGLCDVCRLFGATGWRRRFRLAVEDAGLSETWPGDPINVKPPDRNRGWFLHAGRMGTVILRVMADEETQAQVLALLQFVARWGSLGARPQLGYGLFEIAEIKNQPQSTYGWNVISQDQNWTDYPDLRTFTFFALTFEPQQDNWWPHVPGIGSLARDNRYRNAVDGLLRHHIIPTTPALKNVLRYGQSWSSGTLPHQFFGTLRGQERIRSKIALSWAYRLPNSSNWQIRGWAYPPQVRADQQQEIQQRLQAVLGSPQSWLQAFGVRYRTAEVSFAPTTTFFQSITSTQVQNFVGEMSRSGVQG